MGGVACRLDWPAVASLDLREADGLTRRALVRALLFAAAGAVRVEGAERIAAAPPGSIFALSHHNVFEAVLAPTAIVALRRGRRVRFLVDWMFAEMPPAAWLVRAIDPIPVYAKRALFGLGERRRRSRLDRDPLAEAAASLAAGDDVGIYPEGARQSDLFRLATLRRGLARLARESGAAVVPVGVELPARDRLGRLPRLGRIVLRAGEPTRFAAPPAASSDRRCVEEREFLARIADDLARLSRKSPPLRPTREKEHPMKIRFAPKQVSVALVRSQADRAAALAVVEEVYRDEKRWIARAEPEIAPDPGAEPRTVWLLAREGEEPAGVMRLVFDPELRLPAELDVRLEPGVDLDELARAGRFAEVGRMMVRPAWRRRPRVVLELMRVALAESLDRGVTHLVTAVFEGDPHSPYEFHTRQLGFERIGTHARGELATSRRRILLALDLRRAYARLGGRGVAADLTRGLERRLGAPEAVAAS